MDMENGDSKGLIVEKEHHHNGRTTPQNMSSTSILRKKSDPMLVSNIRFKMLRQFLANLQEVILGTKLAVLFPAVPLAIIADMYNFGRVSAILGKQVDIYIHQD
jgi:Ca2+:H+ antiporter